MSGNHGEHLRLGPGQIAILKNGLEELIRLADGLEFGSFNSERYPLPVTWAVYGDTPVPSHVITDIRTRIDENPVAVLEQALVLAELIESNAPDRDAYTVADAPFLSKCFAIKWCNGWAFIQGNGDAEDVVPAVNGKWRFNVFHTAAEPPTPLHAFRVPDSQTAVYYLLHMLFRYAFVYGRKGAKQSHDIGHFIEDYAPGVLVCYGGMTDLGWTLALAAMKLGVPALVPAGAFPFNLGRRIEYDGIPDIADAIVQFPNIRKLLDVPGITRLPEYCDPRHKGEKLTFGTTLGATDNSFFLMRPGTDVEDGIEIGTGDGPGLGVVITGEHERLEPMDCRYIESRALTAVGQLKGHRAHKENGRMVLRTAEGTAPDLPRVAEVLQKAIKNEFPKITDVHVSIITDDAELTAMKPAIAQELEERDAAITAVSEDTISEFYYCVGCSPFAPDHACVLTPDRVPQCSRPFMQIRTGALFGYDDMSNIHHRAIHADINSFGVLPKGRCLDPMKGEYENVNAYAHRLTGGRTPKIYLHTLFGHPTTGCGCFGIIMFHIPEVDGIGIMHRAYEGVAPDGRSWNDLKYELAGKQTSGVSGCGAGYFASPKFLQADGGWERVVWVTEKIWGMAEKYVPAGHRIAVEDEAPSIDELRTVIKESRNGGKHV